MSGLEPHTLPPVWLGPGAVSDARPLARCADLTDVPVVVGPVAAGAGRVRTGRTDLFSLGVGGVEYADAHPVAPGAAEAVLAWAASRGLSVVVAVQGGRTTELAAVVQGLRRCVDAEALVAVEVDLRTADDQTVLRSMARVREAAPRDLLLLARLASGEPDLVGRARAAVAGGAGVVVVCGQVRLGPDRWWAGPSTLAHTLAGLRELATAAGEQRWPGAPLVASGGVHDTASAEAAVRAGADAVQLGTALWADPTLLDPLRDATLRARESLRRDR
ncbi:hypothetical protein [Ornithinimicrobium panacihumi]|uniref:hypothetical protein n=1 Tax=Ornithinimicrobium panacihumi TaxID=2008449 RepID=UPI003F8A8128